MSDLRGGFQRLRNEAPMCRGLAMDGTPVWYVLGGSEVRTVLTDPRFATRIIPESGAEDTLRKNIVETRAGRPERTLRLTRARAGAHPPLTRGRGTQPAPTLPLPRTGTGLPP
jgi:hypothetical protein